MKLTHIVLNICRPKHAAVVAAALCVMCVFVWTATSWRTSGMSGWVLNSSVELHHDIRFKQVEMIAILFYLISYNIFAHLWLCEFARYKCP